MISSRLQPRLRLASRSSISRYSATSSCRSSIAANASKIDSQFSNISLDEATTSHPSVGNILSSMQHNPLVSDIGTLTLTLTMITLLSLEPALASSAPHHAPLFDVAEGEEFWGNVVRYGRYFITVMLGTGYVMLRPLVGMFKNPLTGILAVALVSGAIYGTKITVDAMLGLSSIAQVEYESSNFM